MRVSAIVLAAGQSKRFKNKTLKALFKINRQPIIIYSLKTLSKISCIKDIIVVANLKNRQGIASLIKSLA